MKTMSLVGEALSQGREENAMASDGADLRGAGACLLPASLPLPAPPLCPPCLSVPYQVVTPHHLAARLGSQALTP